MLKTYQSKVVKIRAIPIKASTIPNIVRIIKDKTGKEVLFSYQIYEPGDNREDFDQKGMKRTGVVIPTDEGNMTGHIGDWLIVGTEGEIYPCRDSVFQNKYEEVGEEDLLDIDKSWAESRFFRNPLGGEY